MCAVLFLVNIRLRGWALPVIAVGLLALVSIIAGAAYPAFVQRFRVAPQELQREQPYIEDNIEATREAFGLDRITSQQRPVGDAVTAADIRADEATISNIRLWRPSVLVTNYQSLQRIRQSDVKWLLPSHGPIFKKDNAQLDKVIARLDSYRHMADFGTCATDWPLMDEWDVELTAGKMPE